MTRTSEPAPKGSSTQSLGATSIYLSVTRATDGLTQLGDRLGNPEPRICTPPLRALTPETSLGFEVIEFARDILQMPLLPWQKVFFIRALELREDGRFRFKTLVLLVARQNGKSTISLVLGLFALYILGWKTVLGVAQDLDTAEEILDLATELVTATEEDEDGEESPLRPWLSDSVTDVVRINGKRSLKLTKRRRWKVKAASRRSARGFTGDLILFDELREQQNWLAWGAITKSTMARPNALTMALSNAGDILSVVLRHLRRIAHVALGDPDGIGELSALERFTMAADLEQAGADGDADTIFLAEWSARPGRGKWEREGWAEANPSMGWLIEERTIRGACQTDPEWVFRTEVLCQWPEGAIESPYPPGTWDAGLNVPIDGPTGPMLAEADRLTGPLVACFDVAQDQSRSSVVVAGWRADGRPQVELRASRVGSHWIEAFLLDPKVRRRVTHVCAQAKGAPASAVLDTLRKSGDFEKSSLMLVDWGGPGLLNAYSDFFAAIKDGVVAHNPQPPLDAAGQMSATRNLGGVDVIDRRNSPVDASPLIAAVGALWLLQNQPEPPEPFEMPPLPKVAVLTQSDRSERGVDVATIRF